MGWAFLWCYLNLRPEMSEFDSVWQFFSCKKKTAVHVSTHSGKDDHVTTVFRLVILVSVHSTFSVPSSTCSTPHRPRDIFFPQHPPSLSLAASLYTATRTAAHILNDGALNKVF
ncbi:hypothetical protein E2C01_099069 [Portunus trituberculatus]|uniref:Uncharacterized protein n=1 Tax=Portunus trituberculatus TaxID=210409 RepID=A0A5B7K2V6_PORTR|nr:hypothetical protein [Portunus trituberculatus]